MKVNENDDFVIAWLKNGVLDPQGKATCNALAHLGFDGVQDVRQGKFIEMVLNESDKGKAEAQVKAMCEKLLANTVVEKPLLLLHISDAANAQVVRSEETGQAPPEPISWMIRPRLTIFIRLILAISGS